MKHLKCFLPLLLSMFLLGCIPGSKNPLTGAVFSLDKKLLGGWKVLVKKGPGSSTLSCPDKNATFRFVRKSGKSMYLEIVNKKGKKERLVAHISRLRNGNFVNLTDEKQNGYLIFNYTVKKKILTIRLLSMNFVFNAIKNKKLEGKIKEREPGSMISSRQAEITDSSANLKRLVEKTPLKDLLGSSCEMQRI